MGISELRSVGPAYLEPSGVWRGQRVREEGHSLSFTAQLRSLHTQVHCAFPNIPSNRALCMYSLNEDLLSQVQC